MRRLTIALASALLLTGQLAAAQQQPQFSGPQPGERLAPFTMKCVAGPQAQEEIDLVSDAKGGPVVVIFFHERTRPAFALMSTVTRMAASRKKSGLTTGVCFLSDDPTETENWVQRITRLFTPSIPHGVSLEGPEGPGVYGLNRNVAMTVLVGKDNLVTANFALVQPSLQADGPKIFKAIVDVTGGGRVPQLSEFAQNRNSDQMARVDPKLRRLLGPLMNKEATAAQVAQAAAAVEKFLAENRQARGELARTAAILIRSGRLDTMGTDPAREKVREWARKYGRQGAGKKDEKQENRKRKG